MPTLPLYTPNSIADASHRVVAPGGYESWHFDAEASSGDVRLVAVLSEGDPYDPEYFRRYLRYRRRPTRRPPPVPAEYRSARFSLYEGHRLLGQFTTQYPPEQFNASFERPAATLGANEFVREADGTLSLRLRGVPSARTWRGARTDPYACLSAQLMFRPVLPHAAHESALFSPRGTADQHRWVVADPLCEVLGTICVTAGPEAATGRGGRDIDFRGRGYHDHLYGTGPLGNTLRRWMRGRLLTGGRAIAFYLAEPLLRGAPAEVRLVEADGAAVRELAVDGAPPVWSGTSAAGLRFAEEWRVRSPALPEFNLARPRVLESASYYTRLTYVVEVGPHVGQALCEVGVAPRSTWRLSGTTDETSPGREAGNAAPRQRD